MAKSVNKVILVGRLGRDPELKYTASGVPFCRFSMATDDVWNDKGSGERQERTEWHNIVAWDRLAEICNQYLTKGRLVYIEGSLQTREWDDQEGNKRKTTEIRARDMEPRANVRDVSVLQRPSLGPQSTLAGPSTTSEAADRLDHLPASGPRRAGEISRRRRSRSPRRRRRAGHFVRGAFR